MTPVTQPTETKWSKFQRQPYRQPCGKQRNHTVEVPCTFEEVLDKLAKDQSLIALVDNGYKWNGR